MAERPGLGEPRPVRIPRSAWAVAAAATALALGVSLVQPSSLDPESGVLDEPAAPVDFGRDFARALPDLGFPDGLRVAGYPGFGSFTANVPVDSRLSSPVLVLSGSSDVAERATVGWRVTVNGQRLVEELLPGGRNRLDRRVPLAGVGVEEGAVRVAIEVFGNVDDALCHDERDVGGLLLLDRSTRVEADLDRPIHTVRDAFATLGSQVTLALPGAVPDAREWYRLGADLGVALTHAGYDVRFSTVRRIGELGLPEDGSRENLVLLGPIGAAQLSGWEPEPGTGTVRLGSRGAGPVIAVTDPASDPVADYLLTPVLWLGNTPAADPRRLRASGPPQGDRVSFETLGVNTRVQQIADRGTWSAQYSLADMPGGRIPQRMHLDVALPAGPGDLTRAVHVELNGRLLQSLALPGPGLHGIDFDLPVEQQRLRNTVEVTVQLQRDRGGCLASERAYPAQVLPSSALLVGDPAGPGFTGMPAQFAGGLDVFLPAAAAGNDPRLLAQLVPVLAEFVAVGADPQYRWVEGAEVPGADTVAYAWPEGAPTPDRPFLVVGNAGAALSGGLRLEEGSRLLAPATGEAVLDLAAVAGAAALSIGQAPEGARGLVLLAAGAAPYPPIPPYGRETALVAVAGGGLIRLLADGRVVRESEVRSLRGLRER